MTYRPPVGTVVLDLRGTPGGTLLDLGNDPPGERTLAPAGLDALAIGAGAVVGHAVRTIAPYGQHTLAVGEAPRVAFQEQTIGPYGQRCTLYGETSVAGTNGHQVLPAGLDFLRIGLDTRIGNADQVLRPFWRNEDLNGLVECGAARVGHVVTQTIAPAGLDAGELGEARVSPWVQLVAPAGTDTAAVGEARPYLAVQWVDAPWDVHTRYGRPAVVRWLDIQGQGYTHTGYGSTPTVMRGNSIEPAGLDSLEPGTPGVRNTVQWVRMPGSLCTAWGSGAVANLNRVVVQTDTYQGAPWTQYGPRGRVLNQNQVIAPPGVEALTMDPLGPWVTRTPVIAPTGLDALAVGAGPMVAYAVRSVVPCGTDTALIGRARLHNTARVIAPPGALHSQYGVAAATNTTQVVRVRPSPVQSQMGGAARVSDAVQRVVQRASLTPTTGFGPVRVGLLEQCVFTMGEVMTRVGAPWVRGPFLAAIIARPLTETAFGSATVGNVNRRVRAKPCVTFEPGVPRVWNLLQRVDLAGVETLRVGAARVADRTQRVSLGGQQYAQLGGGWVRKESQDPPWDQWVYQSESLVPMTDYGSLALAGNVIAVQGVESFAAGAATVASNRIAVRSYYPQTEYGGAPTVAMAGEQRVTLLSEMPSTEYGRAVMSPWWVRDLPGHLNRGGFGDCVVSHFHRALEMQGTDQFTPGTAKVQNHLQVIKTAGVAPTRYGIGVILPHTQRCWMMGIDSLAVGPGAAVSTPAPSGPPTTQYIRPSGIAVGLFGTNRVSNWIQCVSPVGIDGALFGANVPMVHPPRGCSPQGTEQTVWGQSRVSPSPQVVHAQGLDATLIRWTDFRWRARVSQEGRIASQGVETLAVGQATVTLGTQYIRMYGRPARCQRSGMEVSHG